MIINLKFIAVSFFNKSAIKKLFLKQLNQFLYSHSITINNFTSIISKTLLCNTHTQAVNVILASRNILLENKIRKMENVMTEKQTFNLNTNEATKSKKTPGLTFAKTLHLHLLYLLGKVSLTK